MQANYYRSVKSRGQYSTMDKLSVAPTGEEALHSPRTNRADCLEEVNLEV